MLQLTLPFDFQRVGQQPSVTMAVPAARPRAVPLACNHKKLGQPSVLRKGHDPVYGSFVLEEVPCQACGVNVRRTRYPDLASRPDTLPAGDRTVIGGAGRVSCPC